MKICPIKIASIIVKTQNNQDSNFITKVLSDNWAILKHTNHEIKAAKPTFWATFVKIGQHFFQHLVTLDFVHTIM